MSDALERLRNRNRPTVPPRDASLISATPTPPSTVSFDISTSGYPDAQVSPPQDSKPQDPQPTLQTKQSTMRLEQGLSERLQEICREHGISREVLIEALFEYGEAHPDIFQEILSEAQLKNERRQQIANLKRAKSMMEKFGQ